MIFPAEDILLLFVCMAVIVCFFGGYGFYLNRKTAGRLSIYAGTIQEKDFPLTKNFYRLGRMEDPSADIQIKSLKVSRSHAFLKKKFGKFYIVDNNSKNGTFVNGYQIEKGLDYLLEDQDEIFLGGVCLRFFQEKRKFTIKKAVWL